MRGNDAQRMHNAHSLKDQAEYVGTAKGQEVSYYHIHEEL